MASVSVDDLGGGKWKLRWRELIPGVDGSPVRGEDGRLARRARSITVEGKDARDEAVGRIRRALVEEGEYQPPTSSPVRTMTNLERAAVAWTDHKAVRCTASSVRRYTQHMARVFAAIRKLEGIPADKVVPASVLSRDLITRIVRSWQAEGLSESFVYGVSRSALEMWRWVADDPENYPGVPMPPREAKAVLPQPPIYTAPPAPLLAECDAVLRHLPLDGQQTRRIGTFLRYTGLRIIQVVNIRRQDIDIANATLTVTTGKSRTEKAEMRTIPVSRSLVAEVRAWVEALPDGALLFSAWGVKGSERKASIRPEIFGKAWGEAVKWGEARQIAWKPLNRKTGRPEHAFRAAFQAALRVNGVSDVVIDELVGHHGKTVRSRHYAGTETLLAPMRAAVDGLGPIDWIGSVDRGTVISLAKRRVSRDKATVASG